MAKPKTINAVYCLHCTKTCKQPGHVQVITCPHRDYTTTRQTDKVYREKLTAKGD